MIYFGYPTASDSDARKAAKTALELTSLLAQKNLALNANHKINLCSHVGIHSGMVSISKNEHNEEQLVGFTPGIAGKLCSSCPPNSILMSENSHRLLNSAFDVSSYENDAAITFKNTYLLNGAKQVESLFSEFDQNMSTLIGRNKELETLYELKDQSIDKGTAALLIGEAGIGKSRILSALANSVTDNHYSVVELANYPEYKNSALAPFLELFKNFFKVNDFNTPEERDDYVSICLSESDIDITKYIPLLYSWLGVESTQFPPLQISPQKQKELFLKYSCELIVSCILEENSIFVQEDLHWMDPSSLELLEMIIADLDAYPFFLVMTSRPEFTSLWDEKKVKHIHLQGLRENDIESLIARSLEPIK
ncbi:MAG: AAA family ATPase, partial [Lentisphaeraceae bacterium]|nr:AAA family ATPase [Lentisphaeraceae bacterium]